MSEFDQAGSEEVVETVQGEVVDGPDAEHPDVALARDHVLDGFDDDDTDDTDDTDDVDGADLEPIEGELADSDELDGTDDSDELDGTDGTRLAMLLDSWQIQIPATGDAKVDAALARLSEVEGLPPSGHADVYEDVHSGLQDALADLDRG